MLLLSTKCGVLLIWWIGGLGWRTVIPAHLVTKKTLFGQLDCSLLLFFERIMREINNSSCES